MSWPLHASLLLLLLLLPELAEKTSAFAGTTWPVCESIPPGTAEGSKFVYSCLEAGPPSTHAQSFAQISPSAWHESCDLLAEQSHWMLVLL